VGDLVKRRSPQDRLSSNMNRFLAALVWGCILVAASRADDVSQMKIPSRPAAGSIAGHVFVPQTVQLKGAPVGFIGGTSPDVATYALQFDAKSKDFKGTIVVFVGRNPKRPFPGQVFAQPYVRPSASNAAIPAKPGIQQVTVFYQLPGQRRATYEHDFAGYSARIEFGKVSGKWLSGRIALWTPAVRLTGTFKVAFKAGAVR
jgi:hypothetical protein